MGNTLTFGLIRTDGLGRTSIEEVRGFHSRTQAIEHWVEDIRSEEYIVGGYDNAPVYRYTDYTVSDGFKDASELYEFFAN